MAGWHHWLDGRESAWTPGVGDGQGGLACCDLWGRKGSDMTEQLNWTELNWIAVNAGLEEAQAGIKIARRNINYLRYVDDTTLMAESAEELKSLLMKVKEESEKVGLKFNFQKMKIMASGPITSWQLDGETAETVSDFYFGGLQNHCRWWLQPWN